MSLVGENIGMLEVFHMSLVGENIATKQLLNCLEIWLCSFFSALKGL